MVDELTGQANTRNITLTRKAGLIGMVQVSWRVRHFYGPSLVHFSKFCIIYVIIYNNIC